MWDLIASLGHPASPWVLHVCGAAKPPPTRSGRSGAVPRTARLCAKGPSGPPERRRPATQPRRSPAGKWDRFAATVVTSSSSAVRSQLQKCCWEAADGATVGTGVGARLGWPPLRPRLWLPAWVGVAPPLLPVSGLSARTHGSLGSAGNPLPCGPLPSPRPPPAPVTDHFWENRGVQHWPRHTTCVG